jgi:hypothetical protein
MKLALRAATTRSQPSAKTGAGAGGHAVDRGDHRHRHRPHAQRQRLVVALDHAADIGRAAGAGCHAGVVQVLPGAEAAAGAGDHQRPHAGIVGGGLQRGQQLGRASPR